MTWRRRISLLVIVLALTSAATWWVSKTQRKTVTFPDGSTVTLVRVTYGRQHRCVFGGPRETMLAWLPDNVLGWIGVTSLASHQSTNETLGVWLQWRGKVAGINPQLSVIDDDGHESPATGWSYSGSPLGFNANLICQGQELSIFPRRSQSFVLLIRQNGNTPSDGNDIGAEFRIPNPAPRDYPKWKPESLPIRKTDGEMEFTLKRLTVPSATKTNHWDEAEAVFRITRNEQIATNWQPAMLWMSDATGNRTEPTGWGNSSDGEQTIFRFHWPLWPEETWKTRVEFTRMADFPPEDLWTVQGLNPRDKPPLATNSFQTNLHGATIQILGDTGSRFWSTEDGITRGTNDRVLEVAVSPYREGWRLTLMNVRDQKGRMIESPTGGTQAGHYFFSLRIPDDTQNLDLTFALHQSRFIDYLVKPSIGPPIIHR